MSVIDPHSRIFDELFVYIWRLYLPNTSTLKKSFSNVAAAGAPAVAASASDVSVDNEDSEELTVNWASVSFHLKARVLTFNWNPISPSIKSTLMYDFADDLGIYYMIQ